MKEILKFWAWPWIAAVVIIALCSAVVAYNLPGNVHKRQELRELQQSSILQANEVYLTANCKSCELQPVVDDNGWASVELSSDPARFYFEAERANGTFEKVTKGRATLTTSREDTRRVNVYKKGVSRPFKFRIHIIPRG